LVRLEIEFDQLLRYLPHRIPRGLAWPRLLPAMVGSFGAEGVLGVDECFECVILGLRGQPQLELLLEIVEVLGDRVGQIPVLIVDVADHAHQLHHEHVGTAWLSRRVFFTWGGTR
jgi:hypothetical protein